MTSWLWGPDIFGLRPYCPPPHLPFPVPPSSTLSLSISPPHLSLSVVQDGLAHLLGQVRSRPRDFPSGGSCGRDWGQGARRGTGRMLNSRTYVHASPCSPYILLGMRKEGRRSGCSPQGAQFSAMPPPAFSSLLSEFGAHPARLSRVSLPGIFSLSKSPRCLEVPALPGLERRAWLYRGRGLSWRGGAGRGGQRGLGAGWSGYGGGRAGGTRLRSR